MTNCLACDSTKSKDLYQGIKSCLSCGFAWADVHLSQEQWSEIYSRNYFFGDEYVDYVQEEPALRKNFRRNINWIRSLCSGGRLLEIGSAYGFFLDEAKKYFSVMGVDIHEEGCRYAKDSYQTETRSGDFLDMEIAEGSFDVIVMWDVLEHLPRPDLFLQKGARLLKKGGHLFFSTLDISSLPARLQGRRWRQIHPPTHVSYFSWESLKLLLQRSDFQVVSKKYMGDYRSWDNTFFNLLALRGNRRKLYERLKDNGWLRGSYYLNTFDHIHCACVKL